MSLESFQAPTGGVAIHVPVSGITQRLRVFEGKEKGIATDEQVAQSLLELYKPKKQSTTDQYIFQRWIPKTHDAPTRPSALPQDDTSANVNEAGSDPGNKLKSGPLLDEDQDGSNPGPSHVALARPNLEPMHEDFITTVYPKVHKILKHTTEEHVFLENPPRSSGTLSSMKNLDDAFTFSNQFIDDKPTKEEPGKANVESKVESMVTVPIHQVSSSAPPLSTPIIDLTTPKPVSPPAQEPIFIATTETTLLPPPLPQQQSTSVLNLATRSRKRRHDDQDPSLPPLKDSDQSKKKRHDSDASASKQPQAQTSSAWKTSNIIEAPSSSSKQKIAP
ncbi:hypothetical protein Tco_0657817 [Tanacetum coccineum]